MNLEDVFKKFTQEITKIGQQRFNHERIAKKSFSVTNTAIEEKGSGKTDDFMTMDIQNMYFTDINGVTQHYGQEKQTLEDLKVNQIHLYKLQLQWLLVNAYEYFEIYIKNLYMLCVRKNDLWKLKHFGSLTSQDVENLSEDEIKVLAFKVDIAEILNIFRQKLPNLSECEVNNNQDVNLKYFIKIIEMLRHIIVHNNGYVLDKENFNNNILKGIGYSKNSEKSNMLLGTLSLFFDKDDFIDLRKFVDPEVRFVHHCRFSVLIEKMMCFSDLIRMELDMYLKDDLEEE